MPYVSQAQEKFFNVNRKKLEAKGVNVDEWNKSSKGKKLPKRVKKSKKRSTTIAKRDRYGNPTKEKTKVMF